MGFNPVLFSRFFKKNVIKRAKTIISAPSIKTTLSKVALEVRGKFYHLSNSILGFKHVNFRLPP